MGRTSGIEVIAIDVSDTGGRMESRTTMASVDFTTLAGFVDNTIAWVRDKKINLLHIQVHGTIDFVAFGRERLSLSNFDEVYRNHLSKLTPFFANPAWVHLRACDVGQNVALLKKLAVAWDVTVVAGRGAQINVPYEVNTGRYVTVEPDGSTDYSFWQPSVAAWQNPIMRKLRW
jgi:hypothetical protein